MTLTTTSTARAVSIVEKTILGFIAGAAAAVGVTEIVFLVQRIVGLAAGPVTFSGMPTSAPLDAGFAGATFSAVTLTVPELSTGGRAAMIGAAIVSSLLAVGICAVLAWLCVRMFLRKPFVASATWGIGVVAILVIASGLGAPALTGIGRAEAASALGVEQLPTLLVELDLAPIAWGFALAVVAAAFELGQRLQRDSDGLV